MTVLAISKGFFKTLSSRRSHCRSLPDFPRRFGFSRVRRSHLQALQAFRKGNRHSQIHHFASFHQRWGCAAKAHRLDVGATSLASFVNFRTRGRGPTRGLNDRIAARVRRKLSACSPHKNAATFGSICAELPAGQQHATLGLLFCLLSADDEWICDYIRRDHANKLPAVDHRQSQ